MKNGEFFARAIAKIVDLRVKAEKANSFIEFGEINIGTNELIYDLSGKILFDSYETETDMRVHEQLHEEIAKINKLLVAKGAAIVAKI